jgi:serine/threonine protein kinase
MIVMEYLSGHDLSKRLWRHGQMNFKAPSWEQRIRWLEDVAEALSYLHYILKAVHRDVKSPNILLTDDSDESRAKLCDFGLTKIVARGKRRYNQESPHRNSMTKRSVRRSLWDGRFFFSSQFTYHTHTHT